MIEKQTQIQKQLSTMQSQVSEVIRHQVYLSERPDQPRGYPISPPSSFPSPRYLSSPVQLPTRPHAFRSPSCPPSLRFVPKVPETSYSFKDDASFDDALSSLLDDLDDVPSVEEPIAAAQTQTNQPSSFSSQMDSGVTSRQFVGDGSLPQTNQPSSVLEIETGAASRQFVGDGSLPQTNQPSSVLEIETGITSHQFVGDGSLPIQIQTIQPSSFLQVESGGAGVTSRQLFIGDGSLPACMKHSSTELSQPFIGQSIVSAEQLPSLPGSSTSPIQTPGDGSLPGRSPLLSDRCSNTASVDPKCTKPFKSSDEVFQDYPELCNPANIGALAVKLARESIFTTDVLMKSRVTGKGKASPFDTDKVQLMQKVLQAKVYPEMGKEEFIKDVWPICKTALGSLCKRVRKEAGVKLVKGLIVPVTSN